ncbi:TPA: hypothetical protein GE574_25245 [Escherichia coli]|nr:hypothetical protein [Escherichia coli]
MLPSETMIWQPEFTDKTLSRKPGAVQNGLKTGLGITPGEHIISADSALSSKRKLTAVCSHQTRIGNLDAHLI